MRVALNVCLFLLVVGLIAANFLLRPDPARLNYEFIPQMAHAPRYDAFEPDPNFPDGKTLHAPPAGAIARGFMPVHFAPPASDAVPPGQELKSPIDLSSPQALQRGAAVFASFCAVCHGAGGLGNGLVTQRGVPPPPSLLAEHALQLKDGQIFHILTFGRNNMPSYASQLSRQDRWSVIAHVRALQAAAPDQGATGMKAASSAGPASGAASGGRP